MTHRAVVVGAGIAGLVAARVLSDHVDEVVIVERDRLDGAADLRPGVPQAIHAHVLLRRGYLELGRLYPDLDQAMEDQGAQLIDWLADVLWLGPAGHYPRFQSDIISRAASRTAFEAALRDRTLCRPNVRLLAGQAVVGLLGNPRVVHGVRLRARAQAPASPPDSDPTPASGRQSPGDTSELDAWLVVDAAGRSSDSPEWLAELGAEPAAETVIDASLMYSTRLYRQTTAPRDWRGLYVRNRPPSGTRGGAMFPIEGERWVVTMGGAGADRPPTDESGFMAFARDLISPRLYEALEGAEALTPIRGWARTANRWRHFERLAAWPAGYLPMGDALCALNPIYGQGMSVAAMEGVELGKWLSAPASFTARAALRSPDTQPLLKRLAKVAALPWLLATAEDARVEGVVGTVDPGRRGRLTSRYIDAVLDLAATDERAYWRFTRVTQLLSPPATLFDPIVVAKVAARVARRRTRPSPPGPV